MARTGGILERDVGRWCRWVVWICCGCRDGWSGLMCDVMWCCSTSKLPLCVFSAELATGGNDTVLIVWVHPPGQWMDNTANQWLSGVCYIGAGGSRSKYRVSSTACFHLHWELPPWIRFCRLSNRARRTTFGGKDLDRTERLVKYVWDMVVSYFNVWCLLTWRTAGQHRLSQSLQDRQLLLTCSWKPVSFSCPCPRPCLHVFLDVCMHNFMNTLCTHYFILT